MIRQISESFASAGFSVLRFDFYGTGDSDGNELYADCGEGWLSDIDAAVEQLITLSGARQVALFGLRIGATLATIAAARRGDIVSLILVEPWHAGDAFLQELARMQRLHRGLVPHTKRGGQSLRAGQEVLGQFFSKSTLNALGAFELCGLRQRPALRALVLDDRPSSGTSGVIKHLQSLGCDAALRTPKPSNANVMTAVRAGISTDFIDSAIAWLGENGSLAPQVLQPPGIEPQTAILQESIVHETPYSFGLHRPLFGIISYAARAKQNRPAIILINAGRDYRIGPHRLYISIARSCATLGFRVLRMDLTGAGDSSPVDAQTERLPYSKRASDDVLEAMRFLSKTSNVDSFILVGLCSSADLAIRVGLEQHAVTGLILMNPSTFTSDEALARNKRIARVAHAQWFLRALRQGHSWRKLFRGEIGAAEISSALSSWKQTAIERLQERIRGPSNGSSRAAARDIPSLLGRMVTRGVDVFLIVSERDPGIVRFEEMFPEGMKFLQRFEGFRREDVGETDHSFTPLWAQAHITNLITEHLTRMSDCPATP